MLWVSEYIMKNTLILRRFSVLHPHRNLAVSFEGRSIKIFSPYPSRFSLLLFLEDLAAKCGSSGGT